MGLRKHRTVVESKAFGAEKLDLESDVRRLDEALEAVCWRLSIDPGSGRLTNSPPVWITLTYGMAGSPPLAIYYMFDEETVTLLSIKRAT